MWIALTLLAVLLSMALVGFYFCYAPQHAPSVAGGTLASRRVQVGRLTRAYQTYVPSELIPDAPLVIVLHGARQTPRSMRALLGKALENQARHCGFAVAYAESVGGRWNDACKAVPQTAAAGKVDDVGYVGALIGAMAEEHAIDVQQVFVLGYSSGGQMAYRLALEVPQLLAGIAVVAASLPTDGNLEAKRRGVPVRTLIINGTADRINPYSGGEVSVLGFARRGAVRSSLQTAEYFATLAGAQPASAEAAFADQYPRLAPIRSTWVNQDGVAVALYAVQGGGHVLHQPYSRQPRWLGAGNPGFDITAVACEFWGL